MQTGSRSRHRLVLALGLAAVALSVHSGAVRAASNQAVTGVYSEFLLGRFAIAEGDVAAAAGHLLRAQSLDPNAPDLRLQAFLVGALDGNPDALKLAPQLPNLLPAQLMLANDAVLNGDWALAAKRYGSLKQDNVSQVLQPLLMAWSHQGAGDTDAALATLKPFQTGQRRAVYLLHAAMIADLANRTADANTLYRTARGAYHDLNLRLAQVLASWQFRQGHPAEAMANLKPLAAESPELSVALPGLLASASQRPLGKASDGLAEAYLALAASLRRQDSADTALLMLRFALQLRPDLTAARLLMSDLQDQQKRYDSAIATLAPVPPNDPLIGLVRLRRAILAQHQGKSNAALHDLSQLAHDVPGSAVPLMQQGDMLREVGRFRDAVQAYDGAVARTPHPDRGDWSLFYARAIAFDGEHDWKRAEADLQKALHLSPDQPSVLNYLGYTMTEQGRNLPRAREYLEKAAEERPNEGAIIDSLGWVLLHQNEAAGALETLERAVELEPEDPVINAHLGDAYMAAGNDLFAAYQWQHALTFKPANDLKIALDTKLQKLAAKPENAIHTP